MNLTPVFSHPDAEPPHDLLVRSTESPMRLTLTAFGVELDMTIGRETQVDVEDDDAPGSYTSYPVGFTLPDVPFEHDAPHRNAPQQHPIG